MDNQFDIESNLLSSNSCTSYNLEDLNNDESLLNSKLNILHLNIRSCNSNFDNFIAFLETVKMKFSVIVLSETWIKDIAMANQLNIPGYISYHSIRKGERRGGGVSIFIDRQIESTEIPNFFINNDVLECAGIRATIGKEIFNFVGVYRPPRCREGRQTLDRFNTIFQDLLHTFSPNERNIVVGDFNVDLLNEEPSSSEMNFKELFSSLFYLPLINVPTRESNDTNTCIDNIFTNYLDPTYSGTISCNVSDHHGIFSTIPIVDYTENENIEFTYRCHSTENITKFRQELEYKLSLFYLYENFPINDRFEILMNAILKSYEKHCPSKKKILSLKRIRSPWITNPIINSITENQRLLKLSKSRPGLLELREQIKTNSKNIKKMIKIAKKTYYHDKFLNLSSDIKATWKVINSLIKPTNKRNSLKLNIEGVLTDDPSILSNTLNNHFVSIAPSLASNIPDVNKDPISYLTRQHNAFRYFPCTNEEVTNIIKGLKNKKGSQGEIPVSILKKITDLVSPFLSSLFNQSVSSSTFPEVLKTAKVVPIYKSGSKRDKNNYRPIALLPTISKIFEKFMHKRISNYLKKFELLYTDQYGFQSNKSTTDAILKFTDKCYDALNNRKALISVYIDFSKAFDTVDHRILLRKLENYGFRGAIHGWFQSYLSSRQQYVELQGVKSNSRPTVCGVPQGSVLGPLLFLIYINDMHMCSKCNEECRELCSEHLKIINFADDSTAYLTHNDISSAIQVVNRELVNLDKWICANKLSLNTSKTAYTIFSNQNHSDIPCVIIRNTEIMPCQKQKFLGILVDSKLNFNEHIDSISNKVKSANGILWKMSHYVPAQVLMKIYYSLVYPFLTYGVEIWGNSSKVALNRLGSLVLTAQKRTKKDNNPSISLNSYLSVKQIHEYFTLIRCFKYYKLKSNIYFSEKFTSLHPTHNINTRFNANNLFTTPPIVVDRVRSSFFYSAHKSWNSLPYTIRDSENICSFKRKLRQHFEAHAQNSPHQ